MSLNTTCAGCDSRHDDERPNENLLHLEITHYAPVDRIEPYGESGKYKLIFSEKAQTLGPIPYDEDAPTGAMQGPRYTTFEKLKVAKKLSDLLGKAESSDP